jgi:hypothetical protein
MVVDERVFGLGPDSSLQTTTLMSHSNSPTFPQVAAPGEVVEEAYQAPSHSLATGLAIDSRVLTSLYYSQWRPQRQLVWMQAVSAARPIALLKLLYHCFEMPVMEEAAHTISKSYETAHLSKHYWRGSLDMHLPGSGNLIWSQGFLGEAVEGVKIAGATPHHCRIS